MFSLGGTIASTNLGASGEGVSPQLNAEDIVASVPGLSNVAEIQSVSFRRVPSGDLTFLDLIEVAEAIGRALDAGAAGAVVIQGTDTIEETAFLFDLVIRRPEPVVVTGAMRNPTVVGADGPANLLAAVSVAASKSAAGLGTLVVLNDEIHAARFVRKTHTSSLATFRSPGAGPLGWIVEGRTRIALRVPTLVALGPVQAERIAPVAMMRLTLGDDDRMVREVASMGYVGAVVEGFGGGHVPGRLVEALEVLAGTMPVVLASRTGSGELLRETYGFPGSERDVLSRGLMSAGVLDGLKSRVLLSLILAQDSDLSRVRERFEATVASLTSEIP